MRFPTYSKSEGTLQAHGMSAGLGIGLMGGSILQRHLPGSWDVVPIGLGLVFLIFSFVFLSRFWRMKSQDRDAAK